MTYSASVEILVIGNEILIGEIQDTNTSWLCGLVNSRGGQVVRGTMLLDREEEIAEAVGKAVERGVNVLFTSGGLGPTADDLTLSAVARGAGLPLELHEEAREMVRRQYDAFHARGIMAEGGLNPAREKMAWLPQGAVPLFNPVGTAPGVLTTVGDTSIISLPGVPSELKAIMRTSLVEFLDETFGQGGVFSHTIRIACNDESLLEPVLTAAVPKHPLVYIKSLATTVGESPELDIIVSIAGKEGIEHQALVEAACADLRQGFEDLGFAYRDIQAES